MQMKTFGTIATIIFSTALLIFAFQNCGRGFDSLSETDVVSSATHAMEAVASEYVSAPVACAAPTGDPAQNAANIQGCLDAASAFGIVELSPGTYTISNAITFRKAVRLATKGVATSAAACGSNADGRCASLKASGSVANLVRGLILVSSDNVYLDHVVIDGNRAGRGSSPEAAGCKQGNGGPAFNMTFGGAIYKGFAMNGSTSMNALCGTGAELNGPGMQIVNSAFLNNGIHNVNMMWADGLTIHNASDSKIVGNVFQDNTDVDLIFGGCQRCTISDNRIVHTNNFAGSSFAALMLHAWPGGSGDYSGSSISNNTVDCGNFRCGFGLLIGAEPWYSAPTKGGLYVGNKVNGAQAGFLINNATDPAVPVQIGPNQVTNSGGKFLSSNGSKNAPALGMSSKSQAAVQFVQGMQASSFVSADLTGAVLNWWTKDSVPVGGSPSPTPTPVVTPTPALPATPQPTPTPVVTATPNPTPTPTPTPNSGGGSYPKTTWMNSGTIFRAGQGVSSYNGQYFLQMQADGNAVMYSSTGKVMWNSATAGHSGAFLAMQTDGNLVVYSAAGQALWNSKTNGKPGARLAVQDDGNLVIYLGDKVLWTR